MTDHQGLVGNSKSHSILFAWIAVAALALSACGGGGGGGSPSSTSPPPSNSSPPTGTDQTAQLQVTPLQLNIAAQTSDPGPAANIQVSVQLTSATATQTQFFVQGSSTQNGIASVAASGGQDTANYTVTFKAPASLGTGTYTDTITLMGCDDQNCTRQIENSPQTVAVTYTVTPPLPQVSALNPASASAGSPDFTLTVNGSTFASQSVVRWNGSPLTTTFVSANQLTAQVPASDVAASGSYSVTVDNGSGAASTAATFTVAAIASLGLSRISPSQVTAGGSDFMMTAVGAGFTSTSAIAWNGTTVPTTYLSSSILRAKVTAAQIATTGMVTITVQDSASAVITTPLTLTIVGPSVDAVAYQLNSAHTGFVSFKNLTLPSASAWTVDVGGTASYALIVGGRVFVTVLNNGNSQLLALNGTTGATVWGPIAFSGQVNAAYDRGRVYVVAGGFLNQTVSALDAATGNPVWSASLGGGAFTEPPVATDGIVYTTSGGSVVAFDGSNGAMLFQTGVTSTSGIVAVSLDGLYQAGPCTAQDSLPATGTQLWYNNTGCDGGGGATPVVANGLVYSPESSAGSSGNIFDAETGATKGSYSADVIPAFNSTSGFFLSGGTLQGLKVSNNQVLWSFAGDGLLVTTPIVVDNYVFIGSSSGNVYAVDATSGHQVWTKNMGAAIPANSEYNNTYTSLTAGDGLLLVPNGTKLAAFVLSTNP
jgi:outer membrane protein assembly factor BamB